MDTVRARLQWVGRQCVALGRWARPGVVWVGWLLAGLMWTALFGLLRGLEGSKRATVVAAMVAVFCGALVWRLTTSLDSTLVGVTGLILGVMIVYARTTDWVDYRDKLEFLADSQPASKALHVDGDLYRAGRGWKAEPPAIAAVAAGVMVAWLVVNGWTRLTVDLRWSVAGLVGAVAGVMFASLLVVVGLVEWRRHVAYYVRGWRVVDPAAVEAALVARWPALSGATTWRQRFGGWLAPVAPYGRAVVRPREECAG